MNEIERRLAELEQLGLSRRLRMVSGPQGPRVVLDGKPVLLLCSNNYLGLADHPRVREAAAQAAHQAAAVGSQAHELQCLPDARLLFAVRQVVEFREDQQVLVTRERTVHGNRLRHITDRAAYLHRLGRNGETGHARLARRGRQQRGEHLDRGGLASPVGAEQGEDLTGVDRKG